MVPDLRVGLNAIQWAMYEHHWDVSKYFESKGWQCEEPAWLKDASMKVVDGKWSLTKPEC